MPINVVPRRMWPGSGIVICARHGAEQCCHKTFGPHLAAQEEALCIQAEGRVPFTLRGVLCSIVEIDPRIIDSDIQGPQSLHHGIHHPAQPSHNQPHADMTSSPNANLTTLMTSLSAVATNSAAANPEPFAEVTKMMQSANGKLLRSIKLQSGQNCCP